MEFRLLIPNDARNEATSSAGLVPVSKVRDISPDASLSNMIMVDGRAWSLSHPLDIEATSLPKYACISYKWGSDRQAHALFPDKVMSTRTLPSLVTAIKSSKGCNAFWTDVFCVPREEGPVRQATLENLGYIYARAQEVVVVLGSDTFVALQDMVHNKVVSEHNLQVLEADQWVASVWTYQELVNASEVRFVSEQQYANTEGTDNSSVTAEVSVQPSLDGLEFLQALGYALLKYQQSGEGNQFVLASKFPNLNVLENVLADWRMGGFTQYSALSIFSNICDKHDDIAANYYYSILGAISNAAQQLIWPPDESDGLLAEKLMNICESKSDFSFIYSIVDRDSNPKRRWRPCATALPLNGEAAPLILRPIFAWHYWGNAQSGTFNDNDELVLHNMTVMHCVDPSDMSDLARDAIAKWIGTTSQISSDVTVLARLTHTSLKNLGFKSDTAPMIVSDGLIFTLHPIDQSNIVKIVISNQVRFSQGAPGLVHYSDIDGEKSYSPCLFVGSIDRLLQPGESISM